MSLNKRTTLVSAVALSFLGAVSVFAEPTGAPGIPHRWAHALKQAVGTSYEESGAASPVWFTVADSILTEIFYPTVDRPQTGDLQFLVTDGNHFFSEQKSDTVSTVQYKDEGMTVQVSGREKAGLYTYDQEIITDTASPVVRIRTTLHFNQSGLRVFVLFKPAINNSGMQNMASATPEALVATRTGRLMVSSKSSRDADPVFAALVPSTPYLASAAGYVGFSDGWQDLSRNFRITNPWHEAGPGNIALTGELQTKSGSDFTYELALGFGGNRSEAVTLAKTALSVSFDDARSSYENGWRAYANSLQSLSFFSGRSAQIIKMHEDKRNRGAIVASLSKPGVPDSDRAVDNVGGYHLVWPRDLYHAAMGLLAAGDSRTALSVLQYYTRTQKSDGSWAQNFWVDGTPYWSGLQMDEVSFPILLASQLESRKVHRLSSEETQMVRRAANFIVEHGPATQEDRWEEIGGYIPSTLAAEIAALRVASSLLQDSSIAKVADRWQSQLESWTLVGESRVGNNYYLRVSPNGNPNGNEPIDLANGAGRALAPEILDGGFLELVRLKVRGPRDPRILSTLSLYETPGLGIALADSSFEGAFHYRRYNRDGYGPSHQGGYWPLLGGEKGHYAVAAGNLELAKLQLSILEKSALASGLIPEQITGLFRNHSNDRQGMPTGSGVACPLVWAHAEDILLHRSIEEGTVFDAPRVGP